MGKNMLRLLSLFILGFLALFLMTAYWQVLRSPELAAHPRNPRLLAREREFARGGIYDRFGETLADSRPFEGGYKRVYQGGVSLVQTVGYSHPRFGQSGLELAFNGELAGLKPEDQISQWLAGLGRRPKEGNSLITTIDLRLQRAAEVALGLRRGAVVVLKPSTGEILAAASRPGFDPNRLDEDWDQLRTHPDSPLLNRVTQGLYPPGSAFKVFTLAAALETGAVNWEQTFEDRGSLRIGDYVLGNPGRKAYGSLGLVDALAVSSNVVFGQIGLTLGWEGFHQMARDWLLDQPLLLDIPAKGGHVPEPTVQGELAQLAIGQGELLVTPLHMAMLAATVANGGVAMRPYLVMEVRRPNGTVKARTRPQVLARPLKTVHASRVAQAMNAVVQGGTGREAALPGIRVAGKTGTAQNPHGEAHSWFIGFAPLTNPQVAVAVVVEQGGAGGLVAAPIARAVLGAALGLHDSSSHGT
jgi:peptidoglycan glycosyltransferase